MVRFQIPTNHGEKTMSSSKIVPIVKKEGLLNVLSIVLRMLVVVTVTGLT